MKLTICSPEGLKSSERKAISAIEKKFRDSWHGYASFLVNDGQGSMEIDLLLVTHDRFILCEVKEWTGNITSNGRQWIQHFPNGRSKTHPSPIHIKRGHAQRLTSLFNTELNALWGGFYHVEYVIIMSGNATINDLPYNEKDVVFLLDDFLRINEHTEYNRVLPPRNSNIFNHLKRPNHPSQISILETLFKSNSVKQRQRITEGFLLPDQNEAVFRHPKNFYQELTGNHSENQKLKALLRCWDFCQLGITALTQESRAKIALREKRVVDYVSIEAPQVKKDYLMEPKHSATEEDVMEDFVEVYEHPPLLIRLDNYLHKLSTVEDKIGCIRSVLTPFVELHKLGIAHRDISIERLWFNEHSKTVLISGLVAAKFPENASQKSVSDIREQLTSTSISIPEEKFGDTVAPLLLDIYLLGALVYQIAFNERLEQDETSLVWKDPIEDPYDGKLTEWIQKAIHIESTQRYPSALEMLENLSKIFAKKEKVDYDDPLVLREIENYRKKITPFIEWPPSGPLDVRDDGRQSYLCTTEYGDSTLKLWSSLMPEAANFAKNLKLHNFIKRCQLVQCSQLAIPKLIDFGISYNGLYILQQHLVGQTLEVFLNEIVGKDNTGMSLRLSLAKKIISAVKLLHESSLTHGDLKPENILVFTLEGEIQIYFLDFFDLDQHGNRMFNTEYSPIAQCSEERRDIYATYCIIDDIFAGCSDYAQYVREEIKRALGSESQEIPISLNPLQKTLDNVHNNQTKSLEKLFFYENTLSKSSSKEIVPYSGELFVELKCDHEQHYRLFISGAHNGLTIHMHKENNGYKVDRCSPKVITASEIIRLSGKKNARKLACTLIWDGGKGDNSVFFEHIFDLFDVNASYNQEKKSNYDNQQKNHHDLDIVDIWKGIHSEEFEQYPKVKTTSHGEENLSDRTVTVDIEENISGFRFDTTDIVTVTDGELENPWFFGELDLSKSKDNTLVIKTKKKGKRKIIKGNILQLREQRANISWHRRRNALERIIRNEALIPHLSAMFSSKRNATALPLYPLPEPSSELWDIYTTMLDSSKLAAFKYALSGQLQTIMGPPGTGKTTLLAVLLDYLSRIKEVSRILLVSQSHIAVDEVASRVRKTIIDVENKLHGSFSGSSLDMVRLGDSTNISVALLDVHVDALQSQYRTAFLSDIENRLLALSKRLSLPTDLIIEAASVYRSMGIEIRLYQDLKNRSKQIKEAEGDIKLKRESLYNSLYSKFAVYTESPNFVFSKPDMQKEILECLATRYKVNNPKEITKLNNILNVMHHWYQRLSADSDSFAGFMAKTRNIVVGTLVGIGKAAYDIASHQYDVVIIDEAGRASASELAIAMQSARRIILVGDHRQLPPMYEKEILQQVSKKLHIQLSEVEKTDFERAYQYNNGLMLDTQYRMQKPISDLISEIFYDGKLKTGISQEHSGLESSTPWNAAVSWIDTSSFDKQEVKIGTSMANTAEIEIICEILERLTNNTSSLRILKDWADKDGNVPIGIIAGYGEQVNALRVRLDNESWATPIRGMVKIDTIDSYQGSENRIIIFSLVRQNMERKIGFMSEQARVNVALSRARNHLVIVGASRMWQSTNNVLGKSFNYIQKKSLTQFQDYQIVCASNFQGESK